MNIKISKMANKKNLNVHIEIPQHNLIQDDDVTRALRDFGVVRNFKVRRLLNRTYYDIRQDNFTENRISLKYPYNVQEIKDDLIKYAKGYKDSITIAKQKNLPFKVLKSFKTDLNAKQVKEMYGGWEEKMRFVERAKNRGYNVIDIDRYLNTSYLEGISVDENLNDLGKCYEVEK